MISRTTFEFLKSKYSTTKQTNEVTIEEVEAFLSKKGSIIIGIDVIKLLEDIYNVEIGDIIICKEHHPSKVRQIPDPNSDSDFSIAYYYRISSIDNLGQLYIDNRLNHGEGYSGDLDSGIFCFFMNNNIISIIKPQKGTTNG